MDQTERVILTNICMISDSSGNVVVQKREGPVWHGLAFPGGHVEYGESIVDSVIREVYEETGLTIENPRICGMKDWMREDGSRYLVFFFRTERFSGELRSSPEGEVRWMSLDEMLRGELANDMEINLRLFMEEDANELYYTLDNGTWTKVMK